jgi:hypothetical protein
MYSPLLLAVVAVQVAVVSAEQAVVLQVLIH